MSVGFFSSPLDCHATGDAERRSYRCENADGNLKDGFPSFFLHNRKFLNG